jgi:hypothetical protein
MKKITKKQINLIEHGHHDILMDCLDFLLDSYDDDKYTLGYGACLSDLSVRSYRLAEYIHEKVEKIGLVAKRKGEKYRVVDVDVTAKIIEEYFNKALK